MLVSEKVYCSDGKSAVGPLGDLSVTRFGPIDRGVSDFRAPARSPCEHRWSGLSANRQLIARFFPTADRSVFVEASRQLSAPVDVGRAVYPRDRGVRPFPSG